MDVTLDFSNFISLLSRYHPLMTIVLLPITPVLADYSKMRSALHPFILDAAIIVVWPRIIVIYEMNAFEIIVLSSSLIFLRLTKDERHNCE